MHLCPQIFERKFMPKVYRPICKLLENICVAKSWTLYFVDKIVLPDCTVRFKKRITFNNG